MFPDAALLALIGDTVDEDDMEETDLPPSPLPTSDPRRLRRERLFRPTLVSLNLSGRELSVSRSNLTNSLRLLTGGRMCPLTVMTSRRRSRSACLTALVLAMASLLWKSKE